MSNGLGCFFECVFCSSVCSALRMCAIIEFIQVQFDLVYIIYIPTNMTRPNGMTWELSRSAVQKYVRTVVVFAQLIPTDIPTPKMCHHVSIGGRSTLACIRLFVGCIFMNTYTYIYIVYSYYN